MSDGSTDKIFVLILNWNGKSDTLECLDSLKEARGSFKTIVIDNGSTDGSVPIIQARFPEVNLIETGENLGFAEGNNVGIRYALQEGADVVVLLNNDTVVDPFFLLGFMSQKEAGILGGKIYLYDKKEHFDHLGGRWNRKKCGFDLIGYREKDEGQFSDTTELDYACGALLWIRKEVFAAIGLLESKFFLIWEESDFCFRAKRAGFPVMLCTEARIWHKVSASFKGKSHSNYFFWRNRFLFIERNYPFSEWLYLFFIILFPKLLKTAKLLVLKKIQLSWRHDVNREEKVKQYSAALRGAKDYFLRRFGKSRC